VQDTDEMEAACERVVALSHCESRLERTRTNSTRSRRCVGMIVMYSSSAMNSSCVAVNVRRSSASIHQYNIQFQRVVMMRVVMRW